LPRCPNCSAEREDEYCPRCGQRRIPPQELSARHFLEEVADEITDFRKNYKTVRTLLALLRPGLLTAEFLAGRRRPRLSPFKTYLVCAAIFFLSAPVAGFTLAKGSTSALTKLVPDCPAFEQPAYGLGPEITTTALARAEVERPRIAPPTSAAATMTLFTAHSLLTVRRNSSHPPVVSLFDLITPDGTGIPGSVQLA